MPTTWQAIGQLAFLEARVDEFKATQKAKKGMTKIFKRVNLDFHDIWEEQKDKEYEPLKPLLTKKGKLSKRARQPQAKIFATKEDWMKDRERKICLWFYNWTCPRRKNRAHVNFKIGFGNAGKPCVLSEENLYSKKYYASRVKEEVDKELQDFDDGAIRIAITRHVLREKWKPETSETKKEIKDLQKQLVKEKKDEEEEIQRLLGEEQVPDSLDPEELLLMQQVLPEIMTKTLNMIATLTSWLASVILGGPDMHKSNGELTVQTYHVGAGKGDITWKGHVPSIDDEWGKPFCEYLRIVYPECERLRRAVEIDSRHVKNPQSLVEAGWAAGCLNFVDSPNTSEEIAACKQRVAAEKGNEQATTSSGENIETPINGGDNAGVDGGKDHNEGAKHNDHTVEEKDADMNNDSENGNIVAEKPTMAEILYTFENGIAVPLLNDTGDV
ncbi:hypothetical protein FA13DRAFT_1802060 [Coprinellus micaceus]|uniref:Uncharacterized protein n=1 Tax=Coprinellus micaceus TaxID=71717 RepID=A0A4Y7SD60_COPMI|nr:hypothetical protein FA13DRAFT_1802060 [Coprinellus micaceus]